MYVTAWMDLEEIMLSEMRQILYDSAYMSYRN